MYSSCSVFLFRELPGFRGELFVRFFAPGDLGLLFCSMGCGIQHGDVFVRGKSHMYFQLMIEAFE